MASFVNSIAALLSSITIVNDTLTITCGAVSTSFIRERLEEDFTNFDTLNSLGAPSFALDSRHEKAWKIFADEYDDTLTVPALSFSQYVGLLDCALITGSKSWIARLGRFSRPTCDLTGFDEAFTRLDELAKHPHPQAQAIAQRARDIFTSHFLGREDAVRGFLFQRAHRFVILHLRLLQAADLAHFPNLSELTLTDAHAWSQLHPLFTAGHPFQKVSLRVYAMQSIALSVFESCSHLSHLTLSGYPTPATHADPTDAGILPFADSRRCTALQELVLKYVHMPKATLASIAELPAIRHLNFESSKLSSANDLLALEQCTSLQQLNLTSLVPQCNGAIYKLKQRLAHTAILPNIADYTTYAGVISSTRTTGSFGTEDTATESELNAILTSVPQRLRTMEDIRQDMAQELGFAYQIDPIRCIDARTTFAVAEPRTIPEIASFWFAVKKLQVSLIVMVKEMSEIRYFPKDVGQMHTYSHWNGETVSVKYRSKQDVGHAMTLRTFLLDDKEVWHLQINWNDGEGLPHQQLSALVDRVVKWENKQAGSTLVHCLAGEGRTGTFLAAKIVRQLLSKMPKDPGLRLNLDYLVKGLRQQRPRLIHTPEQLLCLLEYFTLLMRTRG